MIYGVLAACKIIAVGFLCCVYALLWGPIVCCFTLQIVIRMCLRPGGVSCCPGVPWWGFGCMSMD